MITVGARNFLTRPRSQRIQSLQARRRRTLTLGERCHPAGVLACHSVNQIGIFAQRDRRFVCPNRRPDDKVGVLICCIPQRPQLASSRGVRASHGGASRSFSSHCRMQHISPAEDGQKQGFGQAESSCCTRGTRETCKECLGNGPLLNAATGSCCGRSKIRDPPLQQAHLRSKGKQLTS